jgi:hypothetical protein
MCHIAAPEDNQTGLEFFFIGDKRHSILHCAESVQIGGVSA